ncbi:MAG: futalosine hydrolase [Bacteroidota bacterium]
MPKILIVAATALEITPVLRHIKIVPQATEGLFTGALNVSVLITGVGMVNTAYNMGKYVHDDFEYIINAGICGAFDPSLKTGEVVLVISDVLAELGAEDGDNFIPYKDLGLGGTDTYRSKHQMQNTLIGSLKEVKGITVNKVHGNDASIKKIVDLHQPAVESMEGAAFLRACENSPARCLQIRAISNLVEKRDKSKWNIPLAVENLNSFIIQFINSLQR